MTCDYIDGMLDAIHNVVGLERFRSDENKRRATLLEVSTHMVNCIECNKEISEILYTRLR